MLQVIATPIGNLGDITLRALEALKSCDAIAAEDTRHSLRLLRHYEIQKPLISLHEHNEGRRIGELLTRLQDGATLALVTDAGMPLISDPGYRLVAACHEAEIEVTVLPGPSAVPTALAGSGLPPLPFQFRGFLPVKSGQRQKALTQAVESGMTSLFFESPHRLVKSLNVLQTVAPDCQVCVARELTKTFEEFRRGDPATLASHYENKPPKGEITLLIYRATDKKRDA